MKSTHMLYSTVMYLLIQTLHPSCTAGFDIALVYDENSQI